MSSAYHYDPETKELVATGPDAKPYPGGVGKFYFDQIKNILNSGEDVIAQIDGETGATQTYKELFALSVKLATFLRSNHIQPGDIISLCSYNHFNAAIVMVAAQFVGAIVASTDPILSFDDTTYLLNMVKPKIVFVSDGSEDLITRSIKAAKINSKLVTFAQEIKEGTDVDNFNNVLASVDFSEDFEPYFSQNLNETCSILFSSGTTGMPKGINLSHNYFLSSICSVTQMNKKLVIVNYASFYWISCVYNLMMAIGLSSARLLVKKFNKEAHWGLVAKYKVNYMILSNTYCIESMKYFDESMQFPHLKFVVIAGGIIPEDTMAYYASKLPQTIFGYIYALTEGSVVAQYYPGDAFGSVGKPSAINQTIKIVDPDTEEALPLNAVGEIRIKRQYQMNGYFGMDSSDAWDGNGYLKTGDLGRLDDDFNLFVVDRIKEMFKYRSWHVVPAKIENVLCKHPDVLHAVVVGKPTFNEDENHALAIVCLHDGRTTSASEIENFANAQLDDLNKIRAGVEIVPKEVIKFTPTAKINRRLLKEMFVKRKV